MTTEAPAPLTEAQRARRRERAAAAIATALRETWPHWRRHLRTPDFDLAGWAGVDGLGDLAAEILVDGTMMKAITIKDGVATLEIEPATELLKAWVAGMRGIVDHHDAKNYVEMEFQDASVSMDVAHAGDGYTVTIQRRYRPTPHQLREQAEKRADMLDKRVETLETLLRRANLENETLRTDLEAAQAAPETRPVLPDALERLVSLMEAKRTTDPDGSVISAAYIRQSDICEALGWPSPIPADPRKRTTAED